MVKYHILVMITIATHNPINRIKIAGYKPIFQSLNAAQLINLIYFVTSWMEFFIIIVAFDFKKKNHRFFSTFRPFSFPHSNHFK